MKDARGHGSDSRGSRKEFGLRGTARAAPAAHQSGVMAAVGKYGPWVAKNAAKLYFAQAAAGAAVGFTVPILKAAGLF